MKSNPPIIGARAIVIQENKINLEEDPRYKDIDIDKQWYEGVFLSK